MGEVKRKDETEGQRNYGESHPTEAGRRSINVSILKKKRSEPKFLLQENEMLEERIKLLAKELTFLKDIFMAHAGSHGITVDDMEIKGLLEEEEVSCSHKIINSTTLLTFFFSGPDERIRILKFAFEL